MSHVYQLIALICAHIGAVCVCGAKVQMVVSLNAEHRSLIHLFELEFHNFPMNKNSKNS